MSLDGLDRDFIDLLAAFNDACMKSLRNYEMPELEDAQKENLDEDQQDTPEKSPPTFQPTQAKTHTEVNLLSSNSNLASEINKNYLARKLNSYRNLSLTSSVENKQAFSTSTLSESQARIADCLEIIPTHELDEIQIKAYDDLNEYIRNNSDKRDNSTEVKFAKLLSYGLLHIIIRINRIKEIENYDHSEHLPTDALTESELYLLVDILVNYPIPVYFFAYPIIRKLPPAGLQEQYDRNFSGLCNILAKNPSNIYKIKQKWLELRELYFEINDYTMIHGKKLKETIEGEEKLAELLIRLEFIEFLNQGKKEIYPLSTQTDLDHRVSDNELTFFNIVFVLAAALFPTILFGCITPMSQPGPGVFIMFISGAMGLLSNKFSQDKLDINPKNRLSRLTLVGVLTLLIGTGLLSSFGFLPPLIAPLSSIGYLSILLIGSYSSIVLPFILNIATTGIGLFFGLEPFPDPEKDQVKIHTASISESEILCTQYGVDQLHGKLTKTSLEKGGTVQDVNANHHSARPSSRVASRVPSRVPSRVSSRALSRAPSGALNKSPIYKNPVSPRIARKNPRRVLSTSSISRFQEHPRPNSTIPRPAAYNGTTKPKLRQNPDIEGGGDNLRLPHTGDTPFREFRRSDGPTSTPSSTDKKHGMPKPPTA